MEGGLDVVGVHAYEFFVFGVVDLVEEGFAEEFDEVCGGRDCVFFDEDTDEVIIVDKSVDVVVDGLVVVVEIHFGFVINFGPFVNAGDVVVDSADEIDDFGMRLKQTFLMNVQRDIYKSFREPGIIHEIKMAHLLNEYSQQIFYGLEVVQGVV